MGSLAFLGNSETDIYFRLAGITKSRRARDKAEAEKIFSSLYADETISVIMITRQVFEWIEPGLALIRKGKDYPLVVTIPGKGGAPAQKDALAELIKRTVGIEIKVE